MELSGILLVDKPAGPTSFDVVAILRRALKVKKVGHTGTLDPAATGVLPICLGDATRLAGYITEGDKAYDARVRLGVTTDTQDAMGKVLDTRDWSAVTEARLEQELGRFRGAIEQTPPMYSAVKVDGQRLYDLARKGLEVERKARSITIHQLVVQRVALPDIDLHVECSKGTYIRALAADLGEALGCGAHLAALRRTRSGPFLLQESIPLQDLIGDRSPADAAARALPHVVPVERGLEGMPTYSITSTAERTQVTHGRALPLLEEHRALPEGTRIRVLDPQGLVVAIAERKGDRMPYLRVLIGGAP